MASAEAAGEEVVRAGVVLAEVPAEAVGADLALVGAGVVLVEGLAGAGGPAEEEGDSGDAGDNCFYLGELLGIFDILMCFRYSCFSKLFFFTRLVKCCLNII